MLVKLQRACSCKKSGTLLACERQYTFLLQKSGTSLGKGQESHPEGPPQALVYRESSLSSLTVKSSSWAGDSEKDPSPRCSAAWKGGGNAVPFVLQWVLPVASNQTGDLSISFLTLKAKQQWKHFKVFLSNGIFPKIQFLFKPKNLVTWSQGIYSRAWWILVQLVRVTKCLLTVFIFKALRKSALLFSRKYSCKSPFSTNNQVENSPSVKPPGFSTYQLYVPLSGLSVLRTYSSERGFV